MSGAGDREHLLRHLWARVMLDSQAAGGTGLTPDRAVTIVADMTGASSLEVGLVVGFNFLSGRSPLPDREALVRDAAALAKGVFPAPLASAGRI